MKANAWAIRFGAARRAADIALLREVERSIVAEELQRDDKIDRAAIAAAFGRPYTVAKPRR
jgi:hypothetical protein